MKLHYLQAFSLGLILCGLLFAGLGLIAQSTATPVGVMDCGCGGGTACLTKASAVRTGSTVLFLGTILLGSGGLGTALSALGRAEADADPAKA